jgi:hypothetical protein
MDFVAVQLWYAIDRVAPLVHGWVALLGKVPAGALSIALLVALWLVVRKIGVFVIVLPGAGAGLAVGAWLWFTHGWHPALCLAVGLAVSAVIFQILANFFWARLVITVVLWPLAVVAVWHLAAGAIDTVWALAITAIGAISIGSLLRRFVNTENHELTIWASDLIDDLRGG